MKNRFLPRFLLLFLVSCGKDGNSDVDTTPVRNIPMGTVPTPEWAVASGYDYSSSMTAVVAVDLTCTYPDLTSAEWQVDTADRLGAFVGNECIGVTAPTDSLFFLYIVAPPQSGTPASCRQNKSGADIRLWYYSARLHNLFLGDTVLHFENGGRIGSVAEPLRPLFTNPTES